MKKSFSKLLALSVCAVVGLALPMNNSSSTQVPLNDAKVKTIRENCVTAQVSLQRIQRSDAATRINRGQTYEVILTRLMSPLNGRLAFNRFSEAAAFTDLTKRYEQAVNIFKEDYDEYESLLSKVLRIKCQDQPVTFYDTLTDAREARTKVSKDIDEIKRALNEYNSLVSKLKKNIQVEDDLRLEGSE